MQLDRAVLDAVEDVAERHALPEEVRRDLVQLAHWLLVTRMPTILAAHTDIQVVDFLPDLLPQDSMIKAGWVTGYIPPFPADTRPYQGAAGEGVAVDADGNVYAAEGPNSLRWAGGAFTKYVAGGM